MNVDKIMSTLGDTDPILLYTEEKNLDQKTPYYRNKHHTNNTVREYPAWAGTYPIVRELLQNSCDHLGLIDEHGMRCPEVNVACDANGVVRVSAPGESGRCSGPVDVLVITPQEDKLSIEQAYTWPLDPAVISNGVQDMTKARGTTAGGYGIGFKDAACALLARGGTMTWTFTHPKCTVTWTFDKHSTPCKASHLRTHPTLEVNTKYHRRKGGVGTPKLTQVLHLEGIGEAFFREVAPKVSLFWNAPRVTIRGRGVSLIDPRALTTCLDERPVSHGVYVRGLWVEAFSSLPTAIVLAGHGSFNVNSRDRTCVHPYDVYMYVARLLEKADGDALAFLREHLTHLVGDDDETAPSFLADVGKHAFWKQVFQRISQRTRCFHRLFGDTDKGYQRTVFLQPGGRTKSERVAWATRVLTAADGGTAVIPLTTRNVDLFDATSADDLVWTAIKTLEPPEDAHRKPLEIVTDALFAHVPCERKLVTVHAPVWKEEGAATRFFFYERGDIVYFGTCTWITFTARMLRDIVFEFFHSLCKTSAERNQLAPVLRSVMALHEETQMTDETLRRTLWSETEDDGESDTDAPSSHEETATSPRDGGGCTDPLAGDVADVTVETSDGAVTTTTIDADNMVALKIVLKKRKREVNP